MNQRCLLSLENTPPRTYSPKALSLRTNHSEGNLAISLTGGRSEYKPDEVQQIITAMQNWIASLVPWTCPHCDQVNETVLASQTSFGYKWVRCRLCKKKTDRAKLGLD